MFWFKRKNDSKPNIKIPMVGEYITFGNYWQGTDSVKTPIEWLVLEVNKNKALLVSRYGLDCKPYNEKYTGMTWEDSDLRKWLNHEFLKEAFTEEEQQRIKLSEVANDDNREYVTRGGNNTQDRVFCLSLAEAERYFKNDSERRCQPTAHARNQGACVDNDNGCCWWWLRSPSYILDFASNVVAGGASLVITSGALFPGGGSVFHGSSAVRPALRLIWNL